MVATAIFSLGVGLDGFKLLLLRNPECKSLSSVPTTRLAYSSSAIVHLSLHSAAFCLDALRFLSGLRASQCLLRYHHGPHAATTPLPAPVLLGSHRARALAMCLFSSLWAVFVRAISWRHFQLGRVPRGITVMIGANMATSPQMRTGP